MHPIIFRIPLPHMPLKLWWALAVVAVVSLVYGAVSYRNDDKASGGFGIVVAIAAAAAGWMWRGTQFEAEHLPIYSYGVMLGLSLVVGWYLTLGLAERDFGANQKETLANCYVVTAIAAIVGARLLYVVTNLDEFKTVADLFALRRGGLVAYGGFLGGFLGSWLYLRRQGLRLLPWADVAVPSLASGLMITRIGCYMFGCDFGKPLSDTAPEWLKKLGTFPHWPDGTLDHGSGSPAWVQHVQHRGLSLDSTASLPVHPTQLYESLVGLALLTILLLARKNQKFRGQIFLLFTFGYGVARFCLEIIRDDLERGEYGPSIAEHVILPLCLAVFAAGYAFAIAGSVKDQVMRRMTQAIAFVPAVVAYLVLKPASFAEQTTIQLSTSQWVAVLTGTAAAVAYAIFYKAAEAHPTSAMAVGLGGEMGASDEREERRREREEEKPAPATAAVKDEPKDEPKDDEKNEAVGDDVAAEKEPA